jgi:muconolactone delta-isomerase
MFSEEVPAGHVDDAEWVENAGTSALGRLCHLIVTGAVWTTVVDDRPVEFLVDMVTTVPDGTSDDEVADMREREAARAAELIAHGNLLRLWRPPLAPGQWRTWGLFSADDADQLETILASMPLRVWRHDVVTPLSPHPSDPGQPSR